MTLFLKPTEDASEVPLCFGLLGLRGLNLIPYLLRRVRLFSMLFAQIADKFPPILALQCVQYSGLLSLIYFFLVCAATFVLNLLMLSLFL